MRKIMKVFICGILLLCLCACHNSVNHQQILLEASQKTMSLTHQDVQTKISVDLGFALDMEINVKAILNQKQVNAMDMHIVIGESEEKYIYVNNYGYYQANDTLIKKEISDDKMNESYRSYVSYALDEEMIESIEYVDGIYEVKVKNESINDLLEEMNKLVFGNEEVTVNDLIYQAKIDDQGYLSSIYISAKMSATINEAIYETPIEMSVEYHNIGNTFEIDIPKNADQYELK